MKKLMAVAIVLTLALNFGLHLEAHAQTDNLPAKKQAKPAKVQIDTRNSIRIVYGYPKWNKNSKGIDSASIIMREGATGRMVQIYLVETEPDSSTFSGLYSISWQNLEKLNVEFYIPEQFDLQTPEGLKRLSTKIANKEIKRQPFLLRKTLEGQQNIEIFDTRDQARNAMKAYQAEQQVGLNNKEVPSDQELETARLAEGLKAKEDAARAMSDRVRMEQIEAARLAELAAQAAKLSAEMEAKKKQSAALLAKEGLALFQAEKFPEALAKFDQAVDLDPSNKSYYFNYGVALYKVENFNKSLVYLRMAEGEGSNAIERDYFIALNYYRQKEMQNAVEAFKKVIATNDPNLSPSAHFYSGVIHFEQAKWEEAQASFQMVLDTSSDPKLDERAEAYMEQIIRLRQFEAERARKWQFTLNLGEIYDSNILLQSGSSLDLGSATNSGGYRSLLSGSARYRPTYEETREWAVQTDIMTMYTLDSQFQSDQDLRNADPTVVSVSSPWTHKGLLRGKGHKLDIVPAYETIFMSVENNETKAIINSLVLGINNLVVMSDDLFSNFNFEVRKDTSNLASSTGDNDSSALKVKLLNSNLHFMNQEKTKIMTTEVSFTQNQANGSQAVFYRIDGGVGYMQPFYWSTTGLVKASVFQLTYPQHTNNRVDTSYTLIAGATKKINDTWSSGLMNTLNMNNSNVDSNQYSKFSVMLTLSGNWAF